VSQRGVELVQEPAVYENVFPKRRGVLRTDKRTLVSTRLCACVCVCACVWAFVCVCVGVCVCV